MLTDSWSALENRSLSLGFFNMAVPGCFDLDRTTTTTTVCCRWPVHGDTTVRDDNDGDNAWHDDDDNDMTQMAMAPKRETRV